MHRRTFIRLLSINALCFAYANNSLANSTKQNNKKVLVIGAGISGLAAANKLQNNGYLLLEPQLFGLLFMNIFISWKKDMQS